MANDMLLVYKERSYRDIFKFDYKDSPVELVWFDEEDYEFLNLHRWYLNKSGYAVRIDPYVGPEYYISRHDMQRDILIHHGHNLKGFVVDHKDGNKLNNEKKNLRVCTVQQNNCNKPHKATEKSPYKGVQLMADGRYRAKLGTVICGKFPTAEEARDAVNNLGVKMYGEFYNNKVK